ncbi:MAG: alpha-D-ribose 1-methylphosphonate 5-triphosphate diphosphatase, partial [Pseudomonadota bacterium]
GSTLMPGFIDMHGDMIEVELQPRAKVNFPVQVAIGHLDSRLAAAGVTTAYAAVSFSRGAADGGLRSLEHTSQTIRDIHAARQGCGVDHRIHARFDITFDNAVGVLGDLLRDDMLDLVSVMDHTPGQGQYRDLERYIAETAADNDISPEEARAVVQERIARQTRPHEMTLSNLQAVSELCQRHGVTLASHDDDTAEKTNLMADIGAMISEFPVTMEAAEVAASRGLMNAMGAPNAMRGESYSGNLSARKAHAAGLLHILAADYHPAAILPALRVLAETDPEGLPGAVRLVSVNPAKVLGLTDRGQIAPGTSADLVVVASGDRVAATLRQGRIIYSNGALHGLAEGTRAVA